MGGVGGGYRASAMWVCLGSQNIVSLVNGRPSQCLLFPSCIAELSFDIIEDTDTTLLFSEWCFQKSWFRKCLAFMTFTFTVENLITLIKSSPQNRKKF